jgi:CheY-like chemotaxis protein
VSHFPAVLCIDDNVLGLAIRKAILESRDFRVFTAENGPAGLEIVSQERIDLVVLDFQMPGMDGGEVAKELRSRHPEIPILLFSGFPGQVPEALMASVDGFVSKGSPPDVLLKEVARLTTPKSTPAQAQDGGASKSRVRRSHGLANSKRLLKRCRQKRRP